MALERRVGAIALTDHDTMSGVAEALEAAAGTTLVVIPGVEINAEGEWGDLHFLGYYIDADYPPLRERLQAVRDARVNRAQRMIERLRDMGMPLKWEQVRALARGESVGRPHIARALVKQGYVSDSQEAFNRLIGNGGPAHVSRLRLTPSEAIQAISDAGGVPVLAHPAHTGPRAVALVPELCSCGLRGLEVYYPHHSPEQMRSLRRLCRKYDLLATGGTDFHGPESQEGALLGSVDVPAGCLKRLRSTALISGKSAGPDRPVSDGAGPA